MCSSELEPAAPEPVWHFVFGSGMHGCLYDYGPCFAFTLDEAIESLCFVFEDSVPPGERARMRESLKRDSYYAFRNPLEAGAHYCEINAHEGPCPENDE